MSRVLEFRGLVKLLAPVASNPELTNSRILSSNFEILNPEILQAHALQVLNYGPSEDDIAGVFDETRWKTERQWQLLGDQWNNELRQEMMPCEVKDGTRIFKLLSYTLNPRP